MEANKNSDLKRIIFEIEAEVRRLLEENHRLREQIMELSRVPEPQSGKVDYLEEEVDKLRRMVEDLQDQEATNRDRIFQIRKLIQEKIDRKVDDDDKPMFGPKVDKKNIGNPPPPPPETPENWDEEGEIGYSPYIGVEEDEPITHYPLMGDSPSPEGGEESEIIYRNHDSSVAEKPKSTPKVPEPERVLDPNKVYTERPKLPVGENPNSFLINDFTQEADPFGDENSKVEDDDFFKSNS